MHFFSLFSRYGPQDWATLGATRVTGEMRSPSRSVTLGLWDACSVRVLPSYAFLAAIQWREAMYWSSCLSTTLSCLELWSTASGISGHCDDCNHVLSWHIQFSFNFHFIYHMYFYSQSYDWCISTFAHDSLWVFTQIDDSWLLVRCWLSTRSLLFSFLLSCDLLSKWCFCPSDGYCSRDSIVLVFYIVRHTK